MKHINVLRYKLC